MGTEKIDAAIKESILKGELVSAVGVAAGETKVFYQKAFGPQDPQRPMEADSLISLASMTKPITAAGVMQQVERGKLRLDQEAGEILPALRDRQVLVGFDRAGEAILRPAAGSITVRHLLTHTSGFGYSFWNGLLERYYARYGLPNTESGKLAALDAPLVHQPGTAWEYGISIAWAGRLLEAISGQSLDVYLRENILAPLGMADTGFTVKKANRLAQVSKRQPDGSLTPLPVRDPAPGEYLSGEGGLIGSAADYIKFTGMLLNHGILNGVRILREETVAVMRQNQIGNLTLPRLESLVDFSRAIDLYPAADRKWGLSFLITEAGLPSGRSAGSIFWGGLANSFFWVDFNRKITGVFFTQVAPFCDEGALTAFSRFERAVYDSF